MKTVSILLIGLTAAFLPVNAHVGLDHPKGGEQFQAGQPVSIKWHVEIPHNLENWDIYYSPDGGTSWEPVILDLPGSLLEYEWNVPDSETDAGQIRIVMDNTEADYEDVSQHFSIHTDIIAALDQLNSTDEASFTIHPVPLKETNFYTFELAEPGPVAIELFTITGSRLLTILNGLRQPGKYTGSWNAFGLADGLYILSVQVGDYSDNRVIIIDK